MSYGLAFAGSGFISYFHMFAARLNPDTELVAMASRSMAAAKHRCDIFNAAPYTFDQIDRMIARDDVDIVFIQGPNYLRLEHALAAIRAGKNIIVEKPMANTLNDANAINDAAKENGVLVGYAENHCFSTMLMHAYQMVQDGVLGNIEQISAFMGNGGPAKGWWWNPELSGGGVTVDLIPHVFSGAHYLLGKPEIARVAKASFKEREGMDIYSEVSLETTDGIKIDVTGSWDTPDYSTWYKIVGDKAALKVIIEPEPKWITLIPKDGDPQDITFPGWLDFNVKQFISGMGYNNQLDHFVGCFRNNETPRQSGQDGSYVLKVLLAAAISANKNQPVEMSDDIPMDKTAYQLWRG